MRRTSLLISFVGLLAVGFILSGCGNNQLDTDKAEQVLKDKVHNQTGVDIFAVTCPDNVTAQADDTFTCTAHGADGTTSPIYVKQTDDQGNITFKADLVRVTTIENRLQDYLATQGVTVLSADCPDVITYSDGTKFTCALQTTVGPTEAEVKLKADGSYTFRLLGDKTVSS